MNDEQFLEFQLLCLKFLDRYFDVIKYNQPIGADHATIKIADYETYLERGYILNDNSYIFQSKCELIDSLIYKIIDLGYDVCITSINKVDKMTISNNDVKFECSNIDLKLIRFQVVFKCINEFLHYYYENIK